MQIKKVGVVGCGLMGSGIAQNSAQSGYQVVVSELSKELLQKGLGAINASLSRSVQHGRITEEEKKAALGRIKGTTNIEDFKECDLVIEAVYENMAEKKKVFSALDSICPKDTILATNTSTLSVIEIAMATKRPDRVLGMHFFSPVPAMKLCELVKSIITSVDVIDVGKAFGKSLGKEVIVAQDVPGFIVNMLLFPYFINAIRMYEAGLATKEDIDAGIHLGLNHPWGPLTLADFAGLDILYYGMQAMYQELKDDRYAPPVLLKKMVAAGYLGRKSGKGFYEYK